VSAGPSGKAAERQRQAPAGPGAVKIRGFLRRLLERALSGQVRASRRPAPDETARPVTLTAHGIPEKAEECRGRAACATLRVHDARPVARQCFGGGGLAPRWAAERV